MVFKGEKYGQWTVIDDNPIYHIGLRKVPYYKVKCSCGHVEEKREHHLLSASENNSGCRYCRGERDRLVKVGDVYKGWKVVGYSDKRIHGCLVYKCECLMCHKIFDKTTNALRDKKSTFHCAACSFKLMGTRIKERNGAVGELSAEKISKIKNGARKRNIKFDLSIKYLWNLYIRQNKRCAITGDYLPSIKKASLDRIDSSKGYVKRNVQWVTTEANIAKQSLSMQELYVLAKKIVTRYEDSLN